MQYTLEPIRSCFTRRGYAVTLYNDDGSPHSRPLRVEGTRRYIYDNTPATFFGNDGRKVRAEAMAFLRSLQAGNPYTVKLTRKPA
jgi:hypothetical protein